jgi:N-glycosylase/DNA lyase
MLGDRIFDLRKVDRALRRVMLLGAARCTMKIVAPDFDLEKTLNCGQVFHWEKSGPGFVGAIGEKAVYVEQQGDRVLFKGAPAKLVANYFSLDHPLAEICHSFPRDPGMTAARDFCRGLRILRQPRGNAWRRSFARR